MDLALKVKAPFVESYVLFDKRNQSLEATEREVIASDQERLVVDAYIRYRIRDPLRFYKSLGAQDVAGQSLLLRLNAALREELGRASSDAIISEQRPAMMLAIRNNLSRQAAASRLGIEVIDVRIRRADLPQATRRPCTAAWKRPGSRTPPASAPRAPSRSARSSPPPPGRRAHPRRRRRRTGPPVRGELRQGRQLCRLLSFHAGL